MKKTNKNIIGRTVSAAAFAALTFLIAAVPSACTDEALPGAGDDNDAKTGEAAYFLLTNGVADTRVAYFEGNVNHTEFANGDVVGVFALDATGKAAAAGQKANARYLVSKPVSLTNTQAATVASLIPVSDADELDKNMPSYLFYYPYNPAITSLDDLKDYTHTVATDQNSEAAYEQSDLLWDVASPSGNHVEVTMEHATAQIIVYIDDANFDVDRGATLLSQPTSFSDADFTTVQRTDLSYTVSQNMENINMWHFGYDDKGRILFRAVVPALRRLTKGTTIIRAVNKKGETKGFSLKADLQMFPGYNYIFTLGRKAAPLPETGDDDSWVLDVLDPETGEIVGLLCREYIRYQPQHTLARDIDSNHQPDQITFPWIGQRDTTIHVNTDGQNPTTLSGVTISSQVWVFYNLKDDNSGIPDLSKGTALRFLYDVRGSVSKDGKCFQAASAWPAPHHCSGVYNFHLGVSNQQGNQQGLFLTDHGHDWIYDETAKIGRPSRNGEEHKGNGNDTDDEYYEFYDIQSDGMPGCMHGGTIYWFGSDNLISHYTMPTTRVSNETARDNGHISIPCDGGKPFVSYTPVHDYRDTEHDSKGESNKAGIVIPHYLVDTRRDTHGKVLTNRYPLVKIGFNQFWMSKSLRARTLTDGTPLVCYSKPFVEGKDGFQVTFVKPWYYPSMSPGYLISTKGVNSNDLIKMDFSPLDLFGVEGMNDRSIPLLYNTLAINNNEFPPVSADPHFSYFSPRLDDMATLANYMGWNFSAKFMSDDIRVKGDYPYPSDLECLINGYSLSIQSYTSNVCGLNLKAFGYYSADLSKNLTVAASLLLKWNSPIVHENMIPLLSFETWDSWSGTDLFPGRFIDPNFKNISSKNFGSDIVAVKAYEDSCFGSARSYASFTNQDMNDRWAEEQTRSAGSNAATPAAASRNVYVALE